MKATYKQNTIHVFSCENPWTQLNTMTEWVNRASVSHKPTTLYFTILVHRDTVFLASMKEETDGYPVGFNQLTKIDFDTYLIKKDNTIKIITKTEFNNKYVKVS